MGIFGLHLPKKVNNIIGGVERQVNIFDNGRTYKHAAPTNNRSFLGQLTHNGVTNFAGNAVLKPGGQLLVGASNQLYNRGIAPIFDLPQQSGDVRGTALNPLVRDIAHRSDATGSGWQTLGSGVITGTNLLAPGSSKLLEGLAGRAIPRAAPRAIRVAAPKILAGAGTGVPFGAVANTGGYLTSTPNPTLKGATQAALKGAEFGALVGGAIPAAGMAGKGAVRVGKKAVDAQVPLNEAGTIRVSSNASPEAKAYIRELTQAQEQAAKGDRGTAAVETKKGFKSKVIDTLAPIEDPVRGQLGREGALPLRNALDRALRAESIAGQFVRDKGLDRVIKGVKNPEEFNQYLIAKHAQDLEAKGINTGRDLARDKDLINELSSKYDSHAKDIQSYNHSLLDRAVKDELISKATADFYKKEYPNYVPFNRVFSDEERALQRGQGSGAASISTHRLEKRLKGSEREIESPLHSILGTTNDIIGQGERNKAAKELVKAGGQLEGNPFGLRELKSSEVIGTTPTISLFEKGKQRRFEVTPEVAAAARSLSKEQLGFLGQVFAVPTRILRLGATSANAAFALANVAKDTASGFINSEHSLRASPANPKVFLLAVRAAGHHGSKPYQELIREGAAGTSFDIARKAAPLTVKRIRSQRNLATRGVYVVTHPGELLRAFEDTIGRSEEFNRAIQYYGNKEAALAKNKSTGYAKMYAADAARNNTVNFARAGDYGRVLNTVLPYLNAGIQGSRTLLRNLKERPAQTASKIAIVGFMPTAAATLWNLSDEKRKKAYDSISDYEKQNNIIIVGPNPKQDKSGRWSGIIKIPTSQEIANLNDIVRNGIESAQKDKKFDVALAAKNIIGTGTSVNAQSSSQLIGQVTPQAVKPFAETALNRNLFTGEQIVPDAIKNLPKDKQANAGTSGTAKVLGQLTGTSPLQIDNAIRTTTGGLGQNLIHVSDTLLAKSGVIKPDEIRGKGILPSIEQRFNSAQGESSGAQYFNTIKRQSKTNQLVGRDYEVLNALLSKEIDANGKPIPQNDKDSLFRNQALYASPKAAKVLSDTARELARKNGKPLDPLFQLSPAKQNIYYKQQATPYKSDDYEKTARDNPWLKGFKDKRSKFFDKNPIAPGAPNERTPFPQFGAQTQSNINSYFKLSDGKTKAQFMSSHPDVQKALDEMAVYTNKKRQAQGYAPYDLYPKAPPEVKLYNSITDKAQRNSWIKSHPTEWAKVQNYFAASAAYQLANNAGQAKYADEDLNQQALKAAYNLGKFDIAKNADGSYSLNPQQASQDNYSKRFSNSRSKKISSGRIRVRKGRGRKGKTTTKAKISVKPSGSKSLSSPGGGIKVSSYRSKV